MKIKNNFITSLIFFTSFTAYGSSLVAFAKGNYKMADNVISEGTEEITDDLATIYEKAEGDVDNVCEVKFTNLRVKTGSTWGGSLTSIYVKSGDEKIDEGELISSTSTVATFENFTATASTTYKKDRYYYAKYALKGQKESDSPTSVYAYWLPKTHPATYSIKFNESQNVSSVVWSDAITNYCVNGDRAPALGYNLEVYDCNGELAYSKTIDKQYHNACTNPDDVHYETEIKFIK